MIIRKNVPKTLKEHKPCKCKCEFESNKCNLNQIWNSIKCWCELKTPGKNVCEKGYIWNSAKCSIKNSWYAESIIGESLIMCDESIEKTESIMTKTVPAKTYSNKSYRKKGNL